MAEEEGDLEQQQEVASLVCVRLNLNDNGRLYVKSSWRKTSFGIVVLNNQGGDAWSCDVAEQEVAEEAAAQGKSVMEYMENARSHLTAQQPYSTYSFYTIDEYQTQCLSWTGCARNNVQVLKVVLKLQRISDTSSITNAFFDVLIDTATKLQARTFEAKERARKTALTHQMLRRIRTGENKFTAKRAHKYDFSMGQKGDEARDIGVSAEQKLNTPLLMLHPAFHSMSSPVYTRQTAPSSILNVNSRPYIRSEALNPCIGDAQIITHCMNSPEPVVFNPLRVDVRDEMDEEDKGYDEEEVPGGRFSTHRISAKKLQPRLQFLSGSKSDKRRKRTSSCNRGITAAQTTVPASKGIVGKRGLISKQTGRIHGAVGLTHARQRFAGKSRKEAIILSDSESEEHRHVDIFNDSDGEFAGLLENHLMDAAQRSSDEDQEGQPVVLEGSKRGPSNKSNMVTHVIHSTAKKRRIDQKERGSLNTFSQVVLPQCQQNDRRAKDADPPLIRKAKGVHGYEGERGGRLLSNFENGKAKTRKRCEGDRSDVQHPEFMLRHDSLDNRSTWFERQADDRGMFHHKMQRDIHSTPTTCRVVEDIHEPVLEKRLHSTTAPSQKETLIPTTHTAFRGSVREGEESKWSTWLKEAKIELQEFTSSDFSLGRAHQASVKDLGNKCKEHAKHDKDVKNSTSGQKDKSLLQVQPSSLSNLKRKLDFKNIEPSTNQTSSPSPLDSGLRSDDEKKRQYDKEKRRDVKQELVFSKVNQDERVGTKKTWNVEAKGDDYQSNEEEEEEEEENGYQCQPEDDTEEVPYVGQTISEILKSRGHGTLNIRNQQNKHGRRTSQNTKDGLAWPVKKGHAAHGLQGEIVFPEGVEEKTSSEEMDPTLSSNSSDDDASLIDQESGSMIEQVPDADYYIFDDDRTEKHIKQDQVWALYDEFDGMPRMWVHVKKVMREPSFKAWVSWLEPHNPSKRALQWHESTGYNISCGTFNEGRTVVCDKINFFSHEMKSVTRLMHNQFQIYPQCGEVWALYKRISSSISNACKQQGPLEKQKSRDRKTERFGFRLMEILSSCGEDQPPEVIILGKLAGFQTLWVPAFTKGVLPESSYELFSHRVPGYRMTGKEGHNIPKDCWDIDPAGLPAIESMYT